MSNEADVETFFVDPLIRGSLGYTNMQVLRTKSIEESKVSSYRAGLRETMAAKDFSKNGQQLGGEE